MLTLLSIHNGQSCFITWLIGTIGRSLMPVFSDRDLPLRMIHNLGDGGVIISYNNHRYALDADTAQFIKVSLEQA